MIVARIESLILKKGLNDALKRAEAYSAAGADAILIHSKEKTPFEINLIRSFKEIDVGLHGRWYDLEYLSDFAGGITISVPIPFFQHWNKWLVFHSQRQFTYGVRYYDTTGYPKSGTSVEIFYKNLFPTYIKNNTDQITN